MDKMREEGKDTTLQEAQIKILSKLTSSQADASKIAGEEVKKTKQELEQNKKGLRKSTDIVNKLKILDNEAAKMANLMALSMKGDEKASGNLYNAIMEEYRAAGKKEVPIEEISRKYGKDIAEVFKSQAKKRGTDVTKRAELTSPMTPEYSDVETKEYISTSYQGLKEPKMVTGAGPVLLHPKEVILPAGGIGGAEAKSIPFFDMKGMTPPPAPVMEPAVATATAGAGTRGDININVTATEKDLAQRIANEVRGVLYKNNINNMG
jgi:hypothetical protein